MDEFAVNNISLAGPGSNPGMSRSDLAIIRENPIMLLPPTTFFLYYMNISSHNDGVHTITSKVEIWKLYCFIYLFILSVTIPKQN